MTAHTNPQPQDAPLLGPINLTELVLVRTEHLPRHAVMIADLEQLQRRAREIAQAEPTLAEEAAFVVYDEARRRASAERPQYLSVAR